MFATLDWTQPKNGGLMSQVIEKEENQLRVSKPRIQVKHIWNPADLQERPSFWREVRPRVGGERFRQSSGTQMLGALKPKFAGLGSGELTRSSSMIGVEPGRPAASNFNRQKPYPDPGVHCRNGPDRVQLEVRQRELRAAPKPWRTESRLPPLPALVPRSMSSSFCMRPGEMPIE